MKAEKLERLTAAHGATTQRKPRAKAPEPAAPTTPDAAAQKPNTDLDDHATQERIRNPEGCEVELSYETLRLYPPSFAMRREIYAFCTEILAESAEKGPTSSGVYSMRIVSLINRYRNAAQVYRHTAYLFGKPNAINDADSIKFATEIGAQATPDDTAALFSHLCLVADIKPAGEQQAKN
jgi:hypothetical protein